MWKAIVFVVQSLCLACSTTGASYHNQAPVSLCAGKEVTTNFVYGDSAVKFINLTVIAWTVRKTKQDTAEIFCYYNNNNGFKIRAGIGDRFQNKVTWVPNTINLKFGDLTANETGFYDVAITIFGAEKEETKDTNATFQLTVKDPCLIAEGKNEKSCTMLDCSSMEKNLVYSWTGQDAKGQTVKRIKVCPKKKTNFTCCVDAMKTKCSSFTAQAGASYHNQAPVSLCAGKEVTTNFVYGDSAVKFINLTVINWTVKKTKQDWAEIFCYYNNNFGFKIRDGQGIRFKDRVTWVPNTINLKFSNLTADDTGFYDVSITIFGAEKEETKDTNATFQLTVKDPCLIANVVDEGGCTMLNCLSIEDNPEYSWTGKDAEGMTVSSLRVCPKEETNYTCCVDAMKTKCSSFTAQAGNIKRGRRTLAELEEENLILDNKRLREETKRIKLEQENWKLANEVFILKKQSSICKLQSEFPDCVHEP
ncbi:uncharacterized protein LOC134681093 isoform X2 [Mytilus trossulus]|uniref:uncharacterized protein LOC134681093 isoform X2 n=1 Tax=Mytilus trossulus TaxID=6551 RepID=UPI0030069FE7